MDSRARPTIDSEEGKEGASLMRGEGVHLEHGGRVRTYICATSHVRYEQISQMYISPVRSVIMIKEWIREEERKPPEVVKLCAIVCIDVN